VTALYPPFCDKLHYIEMEDFSIEIPVWGVEYADGDKLYSPSYINRTQPEWARENPAVRDCPQLTIHKY
jgi:hypothetical protein